MNSEMVKDSWGTAEKINRIISGNIIKEEWIFKNTWLYFENNTLVEWGRKENSFSVVRHMSMLFSLLLFADKKKFLFLRVKLRE